MWLKIVCDYLENHVHSNLSYGNDEDRVDPSFLGGGGYTIPPQCLSRKAQVGQPIVISWPKWVGDCVFLFTNLSVFIIQINHSNQVANILVIGIINTQIELLYYGSLLSQSSMTLLIEQHTIPHCIVQYDYVDMARHNAV